MKNPSNLLLLTATVLLYLSTSPSANADDASTLESFEIFVKKIVKYGEGAMSLPRAHKDGGVAKLKWNNSIPLKFDVKKTDSIVAPYVATLILSGSTCSTKPAQNAETILDHFECPAPNSVASIGIVQSYRFARQKNRWVLSQSKFDVPAFGSAGQGAWGEGNQLHWLFNAQSFETLQ